MEKLFRLPYRPAVGSVDRVVQKMRRWHPATAVALSFVLAISAGTLLLMLPAATVAGHIALIDALFTATSAVCVTGLVVVDTGGCYTLFGQGVILVLIQIGGLGVMTLSVLIFRLLGRSISLRQRLVIQDLFTPVPRRDILHFVKDILRYTLTIELAGAGLLFVHFGREYPVGRSMYLAVFHSVSAFCNAGFSTFANSMTNYRADLLLNLTVCLLIILGGIGFPVLHELFHALQHDRTTRLRLSVQTKTVLTTTLILIAVGALAFALLEGGAILRGRSFSEKLLISLFQSISCRTAGFNTVDIGALRDVTLSVMMLLMFFGASPGSCGGGVKTTTLALMGAVVLSRLKKNIHVNLFKKSIPPETVNSSMSLVLLALALIGMIFFMVLLSVPAPEKNGFVRYLFETVSAFGTVGLSMGVTSQLTASGKLWIVGMMLIGRVGVLTFAYIVSGTAEHKGREYAQENIMIG